MTNTSPINDEVRDWHRRFAVDCNNRAWDLAEAVMRSPVEDAEILNRAHAAAWHWSKAGTELHVARAEMLLGQVYALVGQGELAMKYAKRSADFFSSHDSENWELAFMHAVLANAAAATKDSQLHSCHYQRAQEIGNSLNDPQDREQFEATFQRVPAPGQL